MSSSTSDHATNETNPSAPSQPASIDNSRSVTSLSSLFHSGGSTATGNGAAGNIFRSLPARIGIFAVAYAILFLIYRHCALTLPVNSDHANQMLEGYAMLHGNFLLSHWYLTTVSFFTTDIPAFALGIAIRGFNPVLMHEIPAAVFTGIVCIAIWLGSKRLGSMDRGWQGAATTFALVGMPIGALEGDILRGPFRVGTMLLILAAFAAIDGISDKAPWKPMPPRSAIVRLAVFCLALLLAIVADTSAEYLAIGPVLIVSAIGAIRGGAGRRTDIAIGITGIVALVAAKAVEHGISAYGGFAMPDVYNTHIVIVTLANLWSQLCLTLEGFQLVYAADFWGKPVGTEVAIDLLRCTAPVLVLWSMVYAVRRMWQTDPGAETAPDTGGKPSIDPGRTFTDRVTAYCALGMVLNLAAYAFGNLIYALVTTRYFIPVSVLGAVVAGRCLETGLLRNESSRRVFRTVASIAALIFLVSFTRVARLPYQDPSARRLGEWLADKGLVNGYGGYWCSAPVTVYSRNRTHVRPLSGAPNGVAPWLFGVDERWYAEPANFVVLDGNSFLSVDRKAVCTTFGQPIETDSVEGYTVLIYDHDLSRDFHRPENGARASR